MNKVYRFAVALIVVYGAVTLTPISAAEKKNDSENLRLAKALSNAYAEIVTEVRPSVITIETEKRETIGDDDDGATPDLRGIPPQLREFFRQRPFDGNPLPRPQRQQKSQGMGSGFIFDASGLAFTNNHVVSGATKIKVFFHDGTEAEAEVIGADPKTDIAIIRLKDVAPEKIVPLPLGDSDQVHPGNIVIAIGAPFGLKQTVTCGIISATNRNQLGRGDLRSIMYQDFIQTDATINPGNSGGPLINLDGEVIAINSAISSASGGSDGVGFSIPINMVKAIKDELIKSGSITRGYLGVGIRDVDAKMRSAWPELKEGSIYVVQIYPDTPATKGGMQEDDIILTYDGIALKNVTDLQNRVASTPVGKKVAVGVLRAGKNLELTITIEKQPKNLAAPDGENQDAPDEETAETAPEKYRSEFFGFSVVPLAADPEAKQQYADVKGAKGLLIVATEVGGAADEAGLERGMLLTKINQISVSTVEEFKKIEADLQAQKRSGAILRLLFGKNPPIVVTLNFGAATEKKDAE
jgi:serine protease Do